MEGDNFYATLISDASMLVHPDNQGGDFTVSLPSPIQLNSHFWEVGLDEIAFSQDWDPYVKEDLWAAACINDIEGGGWTDCARVIASDQMLKQSSFTCNEFLTSVFKPLVTQALTEAGIKGVNIQIVYEKVGDRMKFTTPITSPRPVRLELSTLLNQILGFARHQLVLNRYFQSDRNLRIDSPLSYFPTKPKRGVEMLLIYTNIIKPHATGHTMSPLLRIVELKADNDDANKRVVQFKRIQYYPVNMDDISEITVKIYNLNGLSPIQFASQVTCQLHFRRRTPWTK